MSEEVKLQYLLSYAQTLINFLDTCPNDKEDVAASKFFMVAEEIDKMFELKHAADKPALIE